jgi:hypothetical protein
MIELGLHPPRLAVDHDVLVHFDVAALGVCARELLETSEAMLKQPQVPVGISRNDGATGPGRRSAG